MQANHALQGILLLDKPRDLSSNDALQRAKRILRVKKAGHTGSLDPFACGLLPLCIGEATKLSGYLLNADKRYLARIKLGVRTDTGDCTGEIVEQQVVPQLTREQIESTLNQFRGEIDQIPPMHSAIKRNGQPLYKLARKGIEVERESRRVTIYELVLLQHDGDELEVEVYCSKGTYIRTLAEDIGKALGCCGHVLTLRRTQSGDLRIDQAYTLEQLAAIREQEGLEGLSRCVSPMEDLLGDWPDIVLTGDAAFYLKKGQAVLVPRAPTSGWVRLFDGPGQFLGVGCILDDGRVAPKRLINRPE